MPKLSLPDDHAPRGDVRIRRPEERHSGGAWKVAYADFVTALMALFIVLWLMNASQKVKASVSGYFTDPQGVCAHAGGAAGEQYERRAGGASRQHGGHPAPVAGGDGGDAGVLRFARAREVQRHG